MDALAMTMLPNLKQAAAINRIAVMLAAHVTTADIDGIAEAVQMSALSGSKAKKLRALLEHLFGGGERILLAEAIKSLAIEAHHRTVAGTASMSTANAEALVNDVKLLGVPLGELAGAGWRQGLKMSPKIDSDPTPSSSQAQRTRAQSPKPIRHEKEYAYVAQLTAGSISPQQRGRELEKVLLSILKTEGLATVGNIVNPGEQIDLGFAVGGQHYLVECKWEKDPIGLPDVMIFSAKVKRKAEGTFGVFLSMSGFVANINETAARGERLNCVGITYSELIAVLEGRKTFEEIVHGARAVASQRSRFHSPQ